MSRPSAQIVRTPHITRVEQGRAAAAACGAVERRRSRTMNEPDARTVHRRTAEPNAGTMSGRSARLAHDGGEVER
ncbi:hypothetical protein [Nocardia brasiliensis]|uniref:hypothetical protein n=1 Tax=Nocardia brasiliensis TaxID=37326 RepID=UPI0024574657|nr:hypothetical protein [Nocardia brasiliensis]